MDDQQGPQPSGGQQPPSTHKHTSLGQRMRAFRRERDMSLAGLAEAAGVSKGYLSSLENDNDSRRPSADILYKLAQALGVTMSDLLGRKLLPAASIDVPDSLAEFANAENLSQADVAMLASIAFRGEAPRTPGRWRFIYESIRNSAAMDR